MNKDNVVPTHNGILSSHKKNEILLFVAELDTTGYFINYNKPNMKINTVCSHSYVEAKNVYVKEKSRGVITRY